MFDEMTSQSNGFVLSGWEPERINEIRRLLELYSDVDEKGVWKNLEVFLKEVIPVARKYDVKIGYSSRRPAVVGIRAAEADNIERKLGEVLSILLTAPITG